ncbi:hypothetical protein [Intestinibacter sp.]|nr:hypothetical protein [Intestinibacter sp.]MDY2736888.1 hypothetical protein [Intestinibacter sp.]
MSVDLEWEVEAENEQDALSKFYARDIEDVMDEALILYANSENEEVVEG